MRIVCLITVGTFLLSIANAENDVPIGPSGQYHHQHYHQRLPRPIILEPVLKFKSESSPFDWLINMVSRTIKPPKKPPPAMIGPINLPGMAGQVYIRQVDNGSPWDSNHVVIKVVTRDPVTGMNVPIDSGQPHQRLEDPSRRLPKSYGYQTNYPSGRSNNMIQHGYQASSNVNQYSNWQTRYPPQNQHYSNLHSNSTRSPTLNDFPHDDYPKNHQHYDSRFLSPSNYRNSNYQRFQPKSATTYRNYEITTVSSSPPMYQSIPHEGSSEPIYGNSYNDRRYNNDALTSHFNDFHSEKPVLTRITQNPYPDYALRPNDDSSDKIINYTRLHKNTLPNKFSTIPLRHRNIVRNDRMVRNHGPFLSHERTNFRISQNSNGYQGFRQGPMTKFELKDVGGLEVIAAPKLNNDWDQEIAIDKNDDQSDTSTDSDLTDGDDSVSIGNGKSLARGESAEHVSDEEIEESQTSKILQPRLLSYKVIDRSHRSQGSQNVSLDLSRQHFHQVDRMDEKKNRSIVDEIKSTDKKNVDEPKVDNMTSTAVQKMNSTSINRWRFQEGRQPTRIVKAIYRRKPKIDVMKINRESMKSGNSNEYTNSSESTLENSSSE